MPESYDFREVEASVLKLWKDKNIYKKVKDKNRKGKPFYFLQGPPYTSGKLHIAHAWNNSLKDVAMRYRRMNGFDVWDRAGYDMHGLPTARKVMELHKMVHKDEIEKLGVDKFVRECINFSKEKAELMNKDLWRLGVWMDYEHAYMPIDNEFIESEWFLVKRAEEQERLYQGEKTMTWCPSCATAMAKHECEYKEVEDDSIFVKFRLKDKKDEYLIIWTTTPWTITFNLAIMANPNIAYVSAEVKHKGRKEKWIVAKPLAGVFLSGVANKKFKIIDEFKGSKLEGVEYEHPWNKKLSFYKELKKKHPKVHTVVLSTEYVDTSSGTGLVHCAPGCGPEDYEVGYRNNIPPYNLLDEQGVFPREAGPFAGLEARKDDDKFTKTLEKQGVLIATTKVTHDYPHCERCRSPVIFRKTTQWFFKVEDLKDKMIKANQEIRWVPLSGQNAFHSWLDNLRDNSITKQRYWGTPVPIWRCNKCNAYEVFGSASELEKRAGKGKVPDNLHKPWIDKVTFKCRAKGCSGVMKRIPDILDVWIDAGSAGWSCLYYPKNKEYFKRFFPADFILEAKEQVRGWFNLLMVASMIAIGRPSFKAVYMHGMLTDVEGKKMSKSLGNIISPYELVDKHGADTLRYYMSETKPGFDINFSWDEAELKYKNLKVLWNIQNYLFNLTTNFKLTPRTVNKEVNKVNKEGSEALEAFGLEEKYILSKLNHTIKAVTEKHEQYLLNELTPLLEEFFLALSREYIKFIRDKQDKQVVVNTLYECLTKLVRIMAPSTPFITEALYQNLKKEYGLEEESVHLCTWPEHDENMLSPGLEQELKVANEVISLILAEREQAGIGVRWPLPRAEVIMENPHILKNTQALVKKQTNIRKLLIKKGESKQGTARVELDTKLTPLLEQEGFAREIGRRIQALRKKAGLQKNDKVKIVVETDFVLEKPFADELKEKIGASEVEFAKKSTGKPGFESKATIRDKEFRFIIVR